MIFAFENYYGEALKNGKLHYVDAFIDLDLLIQYWGTVDGGEEKSREETEGLGVERRENEGRCSCGGRRER